MARQNSIPSTHLSLLAALSDPREREEAWRRFQKRYAGLIEAWCRRMTFDPRLAEDLTQIVFLKLVSELPDYEHDPRGRFRCWLKTVVVNEVTDKLLRPLKNEQDRLGLRFIDPDWLNESAVELVEQIDQTRAQVDRQLEERVRARVKETTWTAFYETVILRRGARDVAEELGLTVAAVYKAQSRLKKLIFEELGHV